MTSQIRAEFATLDQMSANARNHAADSEAHGADLRASARNAVANFAGGMGEEEHAACMAEVDRIVDEYVGAQQKNSQGLDSVNQTFQQGGRMAARMLGSGA